jgi:hypothetical protein
MRSSLTIPALTLTLALGLVGCSAVADASEAPELTATPASGEVIAGDGYSYAVPEGWAMQDPSITISSDSVAADESGGADDTFADNVNVVITPSGPVTSEEIEESVTKELETVGATDIEILDRVTVTGIETPHISASMDSAGVSYIAHQYYLSDDDALYVVTFSFDPTTDDAAAVDVSESILASWEWS